jgi:hypothetical protein
MINSSLIRTETQDHLYMGLHTIRLHLLLGYQFTYTTLIIPLAVLPLEYRNNFKEGLLEKKSNLTLHAYEECRRVMWNETRILEIESNSSYKKCKGSAHVE